MRTRLNLAGISLPIVHYDNPDPIDDETEFDIEFDVDSTPSWFSLSFFFLF